jgi:hypothetical protein
MPNKYRYLLVSLSAVTWVLDHNSKVYNDELNAGRLHPTRQLTSTEIAFSPLSLIDQHQIEARCEY